MLRRKRIASAIIFILALVMTAGCSKVSKDKGYTAVYEGEYMRVYNDGSLMVEYAEKFDENEYSITELEKMVTDEISEFNSEYSKDNGMSLDSVKEEDGIAKVRLNFATVKDYVVYNNVYVNSEKKMEFFVGTYKEAKEKKYKFDCDFYKAESNKLDKKKLDIDDILEAEDSEKLMVINTTHGVTMRVEGTIKYVTGDVKMKNDSAFTSNEDDNYIIYLMEDKE